MSDYLTALKGSYQQLSGEALPAISSSTAIFANAPAGTVKAAVTFRSGGATLRFDAGAATAQGNGIDYPAGSYEFTMSESELEKIRAIQYGGTTTGYIVYFGIR